MELSLRCSLGNFHSSDCGFFLQPQALKWWLVKVVTRVRLQIRIFFITSLLRHLILIKFEHNA